ncbi:MinD/ParA/CobQ/CobA-like protein [Bythopirellula goksoeyrii]|uniref:MinD/ParA/CobQ/CobA-like protein n=2 Tax=Bythopirellula goksoeyrii TaxID=1400387 RepID=A0A5B9QF40_9BACT|nr:MinD/ParA/CobQ/CobA-like protein [Bythopirellula goksoeyrii]
MLIAFANSKGGVGKSTLAVHLAVLLFDLGKTVALLDTDKQRSSSTWIAEARRVRHFGDDLEVMRIIGRI